MPPVEDIGTPLTTDPSLNVTIRIDQGPIACKKEFNAVDVAFYKLVEVPLLKQWLDS